MAKFIINGGKKLQGSIATSSAKNAAMGILCASLMVRGKVTLHDMPRIQEVERMLEVFKSIGVSCVWEGDNSLRIDSSGTLKMADLDKQASKRMRSSLMLFGALATQVKEYKIYKSGGCKLGERTVRPHLYALEKFGVSVKSTAHYYEVKNKKITAVENLVMFESGDTTTENAIMAAVLAPGKTVIKFASSNYMVQDVCYFLQAAGAKIEGIGTTTLEIIGVKKLKSVEYTIMPDPIVAMTWISLGVTTHSTMTIENCPIQFLELELEKLSVMGQKYVLKNKRKSQNGHFDIVDIVLCPSELVALEDKIYGRPFPGLNIDNLPFFLPILTQAKGRTLVHDWVYENRAIYYLELQKFGAKVFLVDPHRVFVEGKTVLKGNEVMSPSGIRPAMVVLITMIAAKGQSVLRNSYMIERGYEDVVEKLQGLGVDITRVD
ncbi:UDP-N-acetylglucosamine 1-carboxyvinyltransferase [Patescibacteria group bacterium]|nr:UDP-N-acetylglucosamine 1-carboxyvinyltransferase [Patescibacteria group bacterium]MBU1722064.1 UDP-N-acetylglucosamine 1-carboxyvinyltransferase [Patescibacteria group bacterium]MBU1901535.1 UDP-N-acetylglucosamine 1-carboxyvinyltransferase [Patescibacteria group bacterium]